MVKRGRGANSLVADVVRPLHQGIVERVPVWVGVLKIFFFQSYILADVT